MAQAEEAEELDPSAQEAEELERLLEATDPPGRGRKGSRTTRQRQPFSI